MRSTKGVSIMRQQPIDLSQPFFPRLTETNMEAIHVTALHLEVHGQFGLTLDPVQAQSIAAALRAMAVVADTNAEAYNSLAEFAEARMDELEGHAWWHDRAKGYAKTIGLMLVVGFIAALAAKLGLVP